MGAGTDPGAGRVVRAQYEAYPFPTRSPNDEDRRLVVSPMDLLAKINHYGFGGRRSFTDGFRVLVAGGGTGDSAIFLAHQLAHTDARIVYLDASAASLAVARARAERRGLVNVDWVRASILDLPRLGLGPFDYISCLGVLHHMDDPARGLAALESVLAEDGAMALMVYGACGRIHVYQTQALLADICSELPGGLDARVEVARQVLGALPPTNLFRAREGHEQIARRFLADPAVLVDTLLHSQDRAYSAAEVREMVAAAGLEVIAFDSYQGVNATSRLQYRPESYLPPGPLLDRILGMDPGRQESIAEVIDGSLSLHAFYAGRRRDAAARADDHDLVPEFGTTLAREAAGMLAGEPGRPIEIVLRNGCVCRFDPGPVTRRFLAAIDGRASVRTLVDRVAPADPAAGREVTASLSLLGAFNWVVLRTPVGAHLPPTPMAGRFETPWRYEQPTVVDNAAADRCLPRS